MSQLVWGSGLWGVDSWVQDNQGLALGGHRFRLTVRWYDREDLFPTYYTWNARELSYATSIANYTTYQDVLDNIGGGIELDVDLTCDAAGLTTRAGRNSITEHVRATELNFTLVDKDGEHDPRRTPIQSRSRIGARVRLDVRPDVGVWQPLATTWVDSWRKNLDPSNDPQVDVQSADALKMVAQARPAERAGQPEGPNEGTHNRAQKVFDQIPWNDKWGPVQIGYSSSWSGLNQLEWDGDMSALDHLHDCITVEDGLLWVDESGAIRVEGRDWRDTRTTVIGIDMIPNDSEGLDWSITPDTVVCPTSLTADDNDLDIVNAMTVWRSVQFDPDVDDPNSTDPADTIRPDVLKRYAQDNESISYYGEHREVLGDLPAWSNTRTQEIANTWVDRYKDGAQDIGEAEFDLVKRPADAPAILALEWGDTVLVRDKVGDSYIESVHEVIGVRHAISPYRWEATVVLDRKVT